MNKNLKMKIINPINQANLFGYDEYFLDFVYKFNNKNIPNVILFSVLRGTGKSTFIYHLINYILSAKEKEKYILKSYKINTDSPTYKHIINGTHPNFFLIENSEGENTIKIDEIRKLQQFIAKTSYRDNYKIVVINNAEYLNINSSNALLKTLEDPNENTFFFIIHNSSFKILSTIKSRCHLYNIFFNRSSKERVLKEILNQYNYKIDTSKIFDLFPYETPGNLINYFLLSYDPENNININIKESIFEFIDKNERSKNFEFIYYLSILIENYYRKLFTNVENDINLSNYKYNKILQLIYNVKKYNLSEKNLLLSIKNIIRNER